MDVAFFHFANSFFFNFFYLYWKGTVLAFLLVFIWIQCDIVFMAYYGISHYTIKYNKL